MRALLLVFFLLLVAAPTLAQELGDLRRQALMLVNADRAQHGLPPLAPDATLARIAQAHAEDMQRRGYFAHESPEGESVRDRFLAAGGGAAKRVAENIAECDGCQPTPETVANFERGWMESPGHRANILGEGLDRFGFGIAADGDHVYAVQTFAGPGTPRRSGQAAERPVTPAEATERAVERVNAARESASLPPLAGSPVLTEMARTIADELPAGIDSLDRIDRHTFESGSGGRWRTITVVAGECGGCGLRPTEADIAWFVDQWLDDPRHRAALLGRRSTDLGFTIEADGEGRKIAIAVVGGGR